MTSKRPIKAFNKGFTLIEVLIAMVIIAVALGAIMSASGNQASQTGYLKHKTLAHWVAMNEMTLLMIDEAWPSIGEKNGSTSMVNRDWFWSRTVSKADEEGNARKVVFQVFASEKRDSSLATLTGFANQPSAD
ncbi:MAG: type II secretion system minor pseudopilin GspI [Gammaproteobacteria bacterium]|nr:type II secretion system minor pseudopilin GspI [Gammaproteobacteria bacterium]